MKKSVAVSVAIGLALIAVIAVVARLPFSPLGSRDPNLDYLNAAGVRQVFFPSVGDFATSANRKTDERRRVVFVGIDGAAWHIIDPMIDDGRLPTIARLKREGCYGVLRSTDCYVSPPAWCSMMTGYRPERTGIYTFGRWDRQKFEFLPVRSTDVETPSVWDVASQAGRKTAVINVPMTYPVREVNGILVSGLMTPTQLEDRHAEAVRFEGLRGTPFTDPRYPTFSRQLHGETVFHGNRFEFFLLNTSDDGVENYGYVATVVHTSANEGDPASPPQSHVSPTGAFSPWIRIDYTKGERSRKAWCKVRVFPPERPGQPCVVSFSRVLFATGDTDVVFTYPDSLADVLQRRFGYYFPSKFLDRAIVREYTVDSGKWALFFYGYDDWDLFLYVFTQTDNIQHLEGASPTTWRVYEEIDRFLGSLLAEMPRNSTLVLASDHGFDDHTFSLDLNKFFERMNLLTYTSENDIDYENTLAFHNMWCVYFNRSLLTRSELEKRNIPVAPGKSPEDALAGYLEEVGKSIVLGDKRAPFPVVFERVDRDAAGFAPDMTVDGSYPNYLVEFWNIKRPQQDIIRELRADERWNHTRDGIYLFHGDGVRRGVEGPPSEIEDITPTILYLLGLPMAIDLDGRVMTAALEDATLDSTPCYLVESFDMPKSKEAADETEKESLEKKLRSLGYIH